MNSFRWWHCELCGSKLSRVKVSSEVEIKCGYCKCYNYFCLGTTRYHARHMSELDLERAEVKRIRRKEKRVTT